jgi:hypothetical protein
MIAVYATFDVQNDTWNIVDKENDILMFGDIWELEDWLIENKSSHEEHTEPL